MLSGSTPINQELVLYTDNDVMFYHEFNPCNLKTPDIMAVGPEASDAVKNSGVLLINLKGFAAILPDMVSYASAKNWDFVAHDQGLINEYFPTHETYHREVDPLPRFYNWKGYWGSDSRAVIGHWHGPKPERCIKCYIEHLEQFKINKEVIFQCGCPAYDGLWEMAMVADEGNMYLKQLHDFEAYAVRAGLR